MVEHFLEAVHLAQTAGSIAVPCIEYPRPKRGASFICAIKVMETGVVMYAALVAGGFDTN